MTAAGFPHSGISGSTLTCSSPKLFAAYRALLRLSVPRHPPCALLSLDRICSLVLVKDEAHRSTYCLHTLVLESRFYFARLSLTQSQYPDFQITLVQECFSGRSTCEDFLLAQGREAVRSLTRRSRKEVIQPQVPLRLPCYDFAPVTELAFGRSVLLRGSVTDFGRSRLPWRDGRCVQGPGTYSPWCS